MARNSDTYNDRVAIREHGRRVREQKRVREMQRVESARLPKPGHSYTIEGYGTVLVLTAKKGSVKIRYKVRGGEKETTVHPNRFNL